MMTSTNFWYRLLDSESGQPYKSTFNDRVSLPQDADVVNLREAVMSKNSAILIGFVSSQLIVYKNKAVFDRRNLEFSDGGTEEEPMKSNDILDSFGTLGEGELIVAVPYLTSLSSPSLSSMPCGNNKNGRSIKHKCVPPSARGGEGAAASGIGGKSLAALAASAGAVVIGDGGPDDRHSNNNRDQNTIRVTNISEDTSEADLQERFQAFGRIARVYLAKDKETKKSRGFGFVSFMHQQDAAMAFANLQGRRFDQLILKLEWARPSAPKDPAGGTQYRNG